jgi:pyruvate/2-oxoglutarate dehydrogenase complex dihydrolipoamide acyltransferase (E2) component
MAYDHRVLNGRDAAAFLGSVKKTLEDPRLNLGDPADEANG